MGAHTLLQPMKTLCSTCSLRELCLPVGLRPDEFEQLDTVIKQSHRLKKGSGYRFFYVGRIDWDGRHLYAFP